MLKEAICELRNIHKSLTGVHTLNDYDSDAFITFEMQKHGKMIIRGQIGGSHCSHYLVYEFESDQTILKKIIDDLRRLLET